MPAAFIRGLGSVKLTAAQAYEPLGKLPPDQGRLIQRAAREIAAGEHRAQFPVDVFQTGSATSTNMNANEMIAGAPRSSPAGSRCTRMMKSTSVSRRTT
jgi:fumarate hydratase class II